MDEFDLMIKEIMIQRKPEHWLDDIFMNLIKFTRVNNPNEIFYKKGDSVLFCYDIEDECFYYDFNRIFLVVTNKFNINEYELNKILKTKVKDYLKFKKITIKIDHSFYMLEIEKCILRSGVSVLDDISYG